MIHQLFRNWKQLTRSRQIITVLLVIATFSIFTISIDHTQAQNTSDRDGDGFADDVDACPGRGNEGGLGVDSEGCPYYDADWDGVYDRNDACPWRADEYGYGVGSDGCPLTGEASTQNPSDTNTDNNNQTQNPPPNDNDSPQDDGNTPDDNNTATEEPFATEEPGDIWITRDWERDADGDGIPDTEDACPWRGNEGGLGTDETGCPYYDTDWDGFYDRNDECPWRGNEGGLGVDETGCPYYDADWDGFYDRYDECPSRADEYGYGIDDVGCPATESDGDGIPDHLDNCPLIANPDQADKTGDGVGDACDTDFDDDSFEDDVDNCPLVWNPDQYDDNENGIGDECETDLDGDRIANEIDNCPEIYNPGQADANLNGIGNVCDSSITETPPVIDTDEDDVPDTDDNCPLDANPAQTDINLNGVGDSCEDTSLALDPIVDGDGDGIENDLDNCIIIYNPDQADDNNNEIGNACEPDLDSDGIYDYDDNCPFIYNPQQEDSNNDGVGDACDNDSDGITNSQDNCPEYANFDQRDIDGNGIGDICQDVATPIVDPLWRFLIDEDNDDIPDFLDVCLGLADDGVDSDGDGIGDACDESSDMDNDDVLDGADNCPAIWNPDQADDNGNGIGNACDFRLTPTFNDIDGDGIDNHLDNCPTVLNALQEDSNDDGIGDVCQTNFTPSSLSSPIEERVIPFAQTSEIDCLATTICTAQSVFGTTGIDCVSNTVELMETLGYMTEQGAPIDAAVPTLAEIGLDSIYRTDMTWADLQDAIANNQPVIVPIERSENDSIGHAITVLNIEGDTITIADTQYPAIDARYGETRTISREEFENIWTGEGVIVGTDAPTGTPNFVTALAQALLATSVIGTSTVANEEFNGTIVQGESRGPGTVERDGVDWPIIGAWELDSGAEVNWSSALQPPGRDRPWLWSLSHVALYYYGTSTGIEWERLAEFNNIDLSTGEETRLPVGREILVPGYEYINNIPPTDGESNELRQLRETRNDLAGQVNEAYATWDDLYRAYQESLQTNGAGHPDTVAAHTAMMNAAQQVTRIARQYMDANDAYWEQYAVEFPGPVYTRNIGGTGDYNFSIASIIPPDLINLPADLLQGNPITRIIDQILRPMIPTEPTLAQVQSARQYATEMENTRDTTRQTEQALRDEIIRNAYINWRVYGNNNQSFRNRVYTEMLLEDSIRRERRANTEALFARRQQILIEQNYNTYQTWMRTHAAQPIRNFYYVSRSVLSHHAGIDYATSHAAPNQPVYAVQNGKVIEVTNWIDSRGYSIKVKFDDGFIGEYFHLHQRSTLSVGDRIIRGRTKLGLVGNTGNSTGPHLHFQMRNNNGVIINAEHYLSQRGAYHTRGSQYQ